MSISKYDLNEALKKQKAEQIANGETNLNENGEKKLDDVTRVKVLSPGRQVFKRFIRNRLAVFGSVTLIILFLFSFVGPLFYAYGQKQIFRKYSSERVNYALAKENTAYNGYEVDGSVELERTVRTAMNSNIKSMIVLGEDVRIVFGKEGDPYLIRKLGNEVYTVGTAETEEVCTIGESVTSLGIFNPIKGQMNFKGNEVDGLEAALKKAVTKKTTTDQEVEFEGVLYSVKKKSKIEWEVTAVMDGLNYAGDEKDAAFEDAANEAVEAGAADFTVGDAEYAVSYGKTSATVYEILSDTPAQVYSRFIVDAYETGKKLSDEFKAGALYNAYTTGKFEADGESFTVKPDGEEALIVYDADGKDYAEFTTFAVRRYSGEDSMAFDLKQAVAETIVEMQAEGKKSGKMNYQLPMQDSETGVVARDDEGNVLYNDTEIEITQRDTGEFVLNCDQVIYIIDRFASPSKDHILGTDGDGFDVLSRIMYGGRVSLMVGFVVIFLETFLGIIMGGLAGYYGGWVDMVIMRLVDIFYCLPSMPIMIILGAMMDAMRLGTYVRLFIMMAALGIMGWAGVARLVRGQILSLREQEFMIAAESTGIKVKDRIFHHLIPNVMPQLIVTATMGIGGVIIMESTLSFLGLGVKHPLATWGTIINSVSSSSAMAHYAFIWIPVGLLICFTVIAFNFVGDGLRDAYDPKAKR
ncbi:MAG: ABC transporter permease [Lachnospiraceae bacterium]|nr:ABC transporter permease [Lachnospiraceae bacterium]